MKRMLFNATHAEETRVAIVDGQKLIDIDIETAGHEQKKSNIYKGIITRIEPSLEACFVDYGEERHGFLPFKEISRKYFKPGLDVRTATIKEAVEVGQELVVQVEKEERGNKGAALTTFVNLAGRYLVLMSNNPRGGGVSRRVEGEERQELREAMSQLSYPSGMSLIGRTAGIGRTVEELQWDLNYLIKLSEAIDEAAAPQYIENYETEDGKKAVRYVPYAKNEKGEALKRANPAPFLIVEESNLVIRAIRDYFNPEIGEILVDTDEIYEQARQFMSHVMPDMVGIVKRYTEDVPLFSRFQIEHQIETAYSRTVNLPSGGAIVIDHTEALVAIDVNSAHATRGTDIEETAFKTNCEAADEVARQMRLRDLGGLIVIDFIDMMEPKNQHALEQRLKEALRYDRARLQMAKVSRFGLIELSRQRLRPSLAEGSHITCPRCNGVGVIRDTESCALQILRILEEEAFKDSTGAVHAQVPVDVATFLLNEKRRDIAKIEARHHIPIILIPNKFLETPHYHIERIRLDDERLDQDVASYKLAEEIQPDINEDPYRVRKAAETTSKKKQVPVIRGFTHDTPAPEHIESERVSVQKEKDKSAAEKASGFFSKVLSFFGVGEEKKEEAKPERRSRRAERPARVKTERRSAARPASAEREAAPSAKDAADKPVRRARRQEAAPAAGAEAKERPARRQRASSRRQNPASEDRKTAAPAAEAPAKETLPAPVPEAPVQEGALQQNAPAAAENEALDNFDSSLSSPVRKTRRTSSRRSAKTQDAAPEQTSQEGAPEAAPAKEAASAGAELPSYSENEIKAMTESVAEGEENFRQPKRARRTSRKTRESADSLKKDLESHSVALESDAKVAPLSEAVMSAVQSAAQPESGSAPAPEKAVAEPQQDASAMERLTANLEETLKENGLEVVQTKSELVEEVSYEPVKYAGRKRKVLPPVSEEPLVQVQTKEEAPASAAQDGEVSAGAPDEAQKSNP